LIRTVIDQQAVSKKGELIWSYTDKGTTKFTATSGQQPGTEYNKAVVCKFLPLRLFCGSRETASIFAEEKEADTM
jgi:hypothetical protein